MGECPENPSMCEPWRHAIKPDLQRDLDEAREIAEILHSELQKLAIKYAGAGAPGLPELPWSQPDLSRGALIAAVKGGEG
jgi:hypothetical protein